MTIEYNVSQNGQRINTYPNGVLDIKETIDYFKRICSDQEIKPGAVEIVDFRNVTDFQISSLDSEKITQRYQELKGKSLIDKTVFVCKTDLAYGIGRMLQTYHNIANPGHKVVVVRMESELDIVLKMD